MPPISFEARLEELVSRYRGTVRTPSPAEVEALYTDGCAEMLVLGTNCSDSGAGLLPPKRITKTRSRPARRPNCGNVATEPWPSSTRSAS
jgi:hypothetical protein